MWAVAFIAYVVPPLAGPRVRLTGMTMAALVVLRIIAGHDDPKNSLSLMPNFKELTNVKEQE